MYRVGFHIYLNICENLHYTTTGALYGIGGKRESDQDEEIELLMSSISSHLLEDLKPPPTSEALRNAVGLGELCLTKCTVMTLVFSPDVQFHNLSDPVSLLFIGDRSLIKLRKVVDDLVGSDTRIGRRLTRNEVRGVVYSYIIMALSYFFCGTTILSAVDDQKVKQYMIMAPGDEQLSKLASIVWEFSFHVRYFQLNIGPCLALYDGNALIWFDQRHSYSLGEDVSDCIITSRASMEVSEYVFSRYNSQTIASFVCHSQLNGTHGEVTGTDDHPAFCLKQCGGRHWHKKKKKEGAEKRIADKDKSPRQETKTIKFEVCVYSDCRVAWDVDVGHFHYPDDDKHVGHNLFASFDTCLSTPDPQNGVVDKPLPVVVKKELEIRSKAFLSANDVNEKNFQQYIDENEVNGFAEEGGEFGEPEPSTGFDRVVPQIQDNLPVDPTPVIIDTPLNHEPAPLQAPMAAAAGGGGAKKKMEIIVPPLNPPAIQQAAGPPPAILPREVDVAPVVPINVINNDASAAQAPVVDPIIVDGSTSPTIKPPVKFKLGSIYEALKHSVSLSCFVKKPKDDVLPEIKVGPLENPVVDPSPVINPKGKLGKQKPLMKDVTILTTQDPYVRTWWPQLSYLFWDKYILDFRCLSISHVVKSVVSKFVFVNRLRVLYYFNYYPIFTFVTRAPTPGFSFILSKFLKQLQEKRDISGTSNTYDFAKDAFKVLKAVSKVSEKDASGSLKRPEAYFRENNKYPEVPITLADVNTQTFTYTRTSSPYPDVFDWIYSIYSLSMYIDIGWSMYKYFSRRLRSDLLPIDNMDGAVVLRSSLVNELNPDYTSIDNQQVFDNETCRESVSLAKRCGYKSYRTATIDTRAIPIVVNSHLSKKFFSDDTTALTTTAPTLIKSVQDTVETFNYPDMMSHTVVTDTALYAFNLLHITNARTRLTVTKVDTMGFVFR